MQGSTLGFRQSAGNDEKRASDDRRSMRGAFRLAAAAESLRRRQGRREADLEHGFYTDHHDAPLLLIAMGVLLFSVIDAILTLQLIGWGAEEINPLLAMLLEIDVRLFAWSKIALTALVLLLSVSHANFKVFGFLRLRRLLLIGLVAYVCLVSYQATLMYLFPPIPELVLNG